MAVELPGPLNTANRAWIYLQRASVLYLQGDLDGAAEDFSEAIRHANSETVAGIQTALAAQGIFSGEPDGAVSPELLAAVATCIRDAPCYDRASSQLGELVDFLGPSK